MASVRRSRIKVFAAIIGVSLVLAPSPWAFKTFNTNRGANETTPVGTHESIQIIDGEALGTRNSQQQSASAPTPDGGHKVDFGEIAAGSSAVYEFLFGVRNSGDLPVEVAVEAVGGLASAPMHTTVSGQQAPGVFLIEPGETAKVTVGLAVDLAAERGDVVGKLLVNSATGLHSIVVDAVATITSASQGSILNALLGALNEDLQAGFGRLGDDAAGLEKAEFQVEGVWDGGSYNHEAEFTWEATGPMRDVKATLDGIAIPKRGSASTDGPHTLLLEGSILGSVPVQKEIRFTIDTTAPTTTIAVPKLSLSPAHIAVHATDPSGVVAVDVYVAKAPAPQKIEPATTASPSPQPTATPDNSPAPADSEATEETPQPTASPSPSPTPAPTSTPQPEAPATKHQATYDPVLDAWILTLDLPAGYYNIWATAIDPLLNTATTEKHRVEIMKRPV